MVFAYDLSYVTQYCYYIFMTYRVENGCPKARFMVIKKAYA